MNLQPILLGWLASCDAGSRLLLRRSVENVLAAIEHPDSAWGRVQHGEYMLCAATPRNSITLVVQGWPDRNSELRPGTAEISWREACPAFYEHRFEYLPSMLATLMAADAAAEINARIGDAHRLGRIPTIFALLASSGEQHCGVVNHLSLPARSKTQSSRKLPK